jgi:HD-GYP domain-containing protein (c-di-GMP phosphodiesterase class II)
MKIFSRLVWPSTDRFSLKPTMIYISAYTFLILLILQCSFLARTVSFSTQVWMIAHTLITLFVIIASVGISINLFLWRNQAAPYTFYLGPALLIGGIFDSLHFLTNSVMPGQLNILQFGLESQLWLWCVGKFIFALGLLVSVIILFGKSDRKGLNPYIYIGITFSLTLMLISLFLFLNKLLPPLSRGGFPTVAKYIAVLVPLVLMIFAAGCLRRYSFRNGFLIYDAKIIESEKNIFLTGIHFLIVSQLFLLPSYSTNDYYSFIGHLLKLVAFCFFTVSLWTATVTRSHLHIKTFLNHTVASLVEALDAHESSTSGHSKRVAVFARIIGKCYGMNQNNLEQLWLAGTLHDTGKLSISKDILEKKGPLNELEWDIVRKHPQDGVKILTPLKLNWCEQAILQHHERPDGTGYPCGLSGAEKIDLFARIIAVADTFDAITSHRHYRVAKSFSEAREIILRESGKQFDSKCVDAFIKAFPELVRVPRD